MEVVTVLKGLIEDGELLLADGRKLLSAEKYDQVVAQSNESGGGVDSSLVRVHDQFAVWVLANRFVILLIV
jgi:hypothetical protein